MIQKSILDNGIRVITEDIPHAHSVSIGIWVCSGSRHETPDVNGVAHFIEHLLFKGTDRRSALDISREIDSVGGVLNAFTGREYVCYYAKVLHKSLAKAVDLLSDIFLNSLFASDEIEKERMVILQEIRRQEDNPDDYIHDLFCKNIWRDHPLGMSILGSVESVGALSRDAIVNYRNAKYRANDIVITVAGRLSHDDLISLLNSSFLSITTGDGKGEPPLPVYTKHLDVIDKDLEQAHLCIGTGSLPQNHPRRFDNYILNSVLGGSMSSRLFQEIREKLGLAYSVYSYVSAHSDAGSMVIYAGTSPESVSNVMEIIMRELKRLKTEPASLLEIDSAREQIKGNILLALESSDNKMTKLAKNEIYFGRHVPLDEVMSGFDRVTPESVLHLANELFADAPFTLELMGKVGGLRIDPSTLTI